METRRRRELYIKPTLGVNANFLMNPSFSENSGSERLDTDSDNYTSLKSLAGIEATYAFASGLYVSARMFYTHEFCDESYDISSTISGTSTALFTKGWKMDADAGVFGVGIGYDINSQWRIYADYSAEVSSEVYHNVNAGIQLRF